MKQAAVYNVTDYKYDKSNQEFSYLELNHEAVPLADASSLDNNREIEVTLSGVSEVTPSSGKVAMKKVTVTALFKLYAFDSSGGQMAYIKGSDTLADTGTAWLATDAGLVEKTYTKEGTTVFSIATDPEHPSVSFSRRIAGDIEF